MTASDRPTEVPEGPGTEATPAAPAGPGTVSRVARRRSGAVIAGVAGGVADHLGVDPFRVRLVLTALCALGGSGVLVYAALWIVCPLEPPGRGRVLGERERWQAVGMAVLGVGLGAVLSAVGDGLVGWVVGPLGVALVGAAVVWREADTDDGPRAALSRRVLFGGRAGVVRALAGVLLTAGGIMAFLLGRLDLGQVQFGLLAALATLVGVVVLTVPWWLRLVRELGAERRARIRGQERAEIAAHLHDSVLQTLALIQKQSGDDVAGREVRRLARRQERELRSWLYARGGSGTPDATAGPGDPDETGTARPTTVTAALAAAAAEVEDDHGVRVAPVVVGDTALTEPLVALVAAAREALVNAAKHSGAEEISVYAEVEAETVAVFVRDRGVGFDPDAVPADRRGLAGSVHGRMARYGGRARLRTTLGEGTEVGLTMRRTADAGAGGNGPHGDSTNGNGGTNGNGTAAGADDAPRATTSEGSA